MAVEAVGDVELLLEVLAEREVDEPASCRGELHRGCEAALDDGDVASGEMPVQVGEVPADFEPIDRSQARGVDAWPGVELEDSPQLPAEVAIERARKQVGALPQPAPGA